MHRHTRHPLEAALDQLAAAVDAEDNPQDMALWAVSALANRLDLVTVTVEDEDDLEVVRELDQSQ